MINTYFSKRYTNIIFYLSEVSNEIFEIVLRYCNINEVYYDLDEDQVY